MRELIEPVLLAKIIDKHKHNKNKKGIETIRCFLSHYSDNYTDDEKHWLLLHLK